MRVFLAWALLVVLPIALALAGLDYFLSEYAIFSESARLSEAINELENYKNAQVVENFLTAQLPKISRLQTSDKHRSHEELKKSIDRLIGGQSMLCVFFNKDRSRLRSVTEKPQGLDISVFPPATLFRKQIEMLGKDLIAGEQTFEQQQHSARERQANSLLIQQMFKTLTPVTLKPNRVVKNLSARYDGDLYFIYCEFSVPSPQTDGFLAVIRGREISENFILQSLKREFPLCRTIFRPKSILKQLRPPPTFFSGIERFADRLLITAPADQRFIRHVIHGGGIRLKESETFSFPFIQYHLPLSKMQHSLTSFKQPCKWIAGMIIFFSGLFCLKTVLSGIDLKSSFKKRILATTGLAAMFPFIFLTVSLYLHQQYDEFLQKINLVQHISTKISLINSEMEQYLAKLEGKLSIYLQQLRNIDLNDERAIDEIFTEIGKNIPVTKLAIQTLSNNINKLFPERRSGTMQNDASEIIEKFLPMHCLFLLRESEPSDRKPKDTLEMPGDTIKIAFIGDSLISNGSFNRIDQNEFPIWMTTAKIHDSKTADQQVSALLSCRIEPEPLIKTFFSQSQMAKTNYEETYGIYRIKYGFFPVEQSGMQQVWSGSGHVDEPSLQSANSNNQVANFTSKNAADEEIAISRVNNKIPHKAIACAVAERKIPILSPAVTAIIGCVIYLALVLFTVSGLLEVFFVEPVMAIAANAEQIARGHDTWNLQLSSGDELETLNRSFHTMVKGLQERNMLKNYVSTDAYSDLAATSDMKLAPGGEYREATIIFTTIKGYENLTTSQSPAQTIACLNRFIAICDRLVKENSGSFDKIMGNTLMLVFRETEDEKESHALRAARTALQLSQEASQVISSNGILAGMSSGTVISGKIGSYAGKLDFTVIGNPVNLAARLKTEASDSSTGIIISGATMRLLRGRGRVNFLRRCSLKGKAREYNIYELCELREG